MAALVHVFVLARRLPEIVDQLTCNADYVSVMTLAQTVGPQSKTGHAIIVQVGYFWLDLALLPLPSTKVLWAVRAVRDGAGCAGAAGPGGGPAKFTRPLL